MIPYSIASILVIVPTPGISVTYTLLDWVDVAKLYVASVVPLQFMPPDVPLAS